MCDKDTKLSKLITIWFTVIFYSVLCLMISIIFFQKRVGLFDILHTMFPLSSKTSWFVIAYFGMLICSRYINIVINQLDKTKYQMTIILLTVVFVVWNDIALNADIFELKNGYCFAWFIYIYIVTGYVKKYNVAEKIHHPFSLCFISSFMNLGITFIIYVLINRFPLINEYISTELLVRYNSLLVVCASFFLFIGFLKIKISFGNVLSRMTCYLASFSLDVYLFHHNAYIRDDMWSKIKQIVNLQIDSFFVLKIFAIVFIVFALGCLSGNIRKFVLGRLFRNKLFQNLFNRVDSFFEWK